MTETQTHQPNHNNEDCYGAYDNITGLETYDDMIAGHNENMRQSNKYLFIKLSHVK